MLRICVLAISSMLALSQSPHLRADIYKYVDSKGYVYFTDKPKHTGYKRVIRTNKKSVAVVKIEQKRRQYASIIRSAASKHSLDLNLLHAVIRAESAYNSKAVSNKGAVGLMQLMPATAKRYGVNDRLDPWENVNGGAHYLSDLVQLFKSDIRLAVAAYNAGENAVIKYGNQVPPYDETQRYVSRVLKFYKR